MIEESYQKVTAQYRAEQQKWQMLFEQSVSSYNSGQSELARQGFMQVIESGYPVKGDKTPEQYVLLIDTGNTIEPISPSVDMMSPDEADLDVPSFSEDMDDDIEPIDLLEIAVDRQVGDSASLQAQQEELSYLEVVKQKRAVQVDYTMAMVKDALSTIAAAKTLEKRVL